ERDAGRHPAGTEHECQRRRESVAVPCSSIDQKVLYGIKVLTIAAAGQLERIAEVSGKFQIIGERAGNRFVIRRRGREVRVLFIEYVGGEFSLFHQHLNEAVRPLSQDREVTQFGVILGTILRKRNQWRTDVRLGNSFGDLSI